MSILGRTPSLSPLPLLRFTRCLIILCLLWSGTFAEHAIANSYLQELISQAEEKQLWNNRLWHVLLHYRSGVFGGVESEADGEKFFLSPQGKTDSKKELIATLQHFFSDRGVGRTDQYAQCAFIARYHWLKEQLSFDSTRLPEQTCERFDDWFKEMNTESITMIFPAGFMNNPSSMFGHTLLRLDQKGQTDSTRILAYTINYAADVPPNQGILYAPKGLIGVYQGYFSTIPYYLKVQEYGDIENRDIWEYQLNFTQSQVRRLLMHAWELGNTYFDYFFFKENCAYHILSLLEVADPELHLTDKFFIWTVPTDTIRLLVNEPGLVGSKVFRPARSTQIKHKRSLLSDEETVWFDRISNDPAASSVEKFEGLPLDRRAFVLDVASDFLRYRSVTRESKAEEYKAKNKGVLVQRSKLGVPSPKLVIPPSISRPETGHHTSRAGVGVGLRGKELFEEVSIRAGYHDQLDPDQGFTPGAQIEAVALRLRHYESRDHYRVEEFSLLNILSLSPIDAVFRSPSWKLRTGVDTFRTRSNRLFSNVNLNGGIGASVESAWLGHSLWFAFAEVDFNYGDGHEELHRIGGGGTFGVMSTLTDRLKLLVSGTYLGYPVGDQSDDIRAFVGTRYTLHKDVSLRFEFMHRDHDDQGVGLVHFFF